MTDTDPGTLTTNDSRAATHWCRCGFRARLPGVSGATTCPVCCVCEVGTYLEGANTALAPCPQEDQTFQVVQEPARLILAARIARSEARGRESLRAGLADAIEEAADLYVREMQARMEGPLRPWVFARVAVHGHVALDGRPSGRDDGTVDGVLCLDASSPSDVPLRWLHHVCFGAHPDTRKMLTCLHEFVVVNALSGDAHRCVLGLSEAVESAPTVRVSDLIGAPPPFRLALRACRMRSLDLAEVWNR